MGVFSPNCDSPLWAFFEISGSIRNFFATVLHVVLIFKNISADLIKTHLVTLFQMLPLHFPCLAIEDVLKR
jgi:hypothetical protein